MRSSIPPFVSRGMLLILVFSGCGKSADGPVVPETIGGVSKDTAVDGLDEDERLDFCLALRDVPSVPALEVSMEGACVAAVLSMDVSEQDECAELRDMCVETDGDPTEFEAFSGLEQAFEDLRIRECEPLDCPDTTAGDIYACVSAASNALSSRYDQLAEEVSALRCEDEDVSLESLDLTEPAQPSECMDLAEACPGFFDLL